MPTLHPCVENAVWNLRQAAWQCWDMGLKEQHQLWFFICATLIFVLGDSNMKIQQQRQLDDRQKDTEQSHSVDY